MSVAVRCSASSDTIEADGGKPQRSQNGSELRVADRDDVVAVSGKIRPRGDGGARGRHPLRRIQVQDEAGRHGQEIVDRDLVLLGGREAEVVGDGHGENMGAGLGRGAGESTALRVEGQAGWQGSGG